MDTNNFMTTANSELQNLEIYNPLLPRDDMMYPPGDVSDKDHKLGSGDLLLSQKQMQQHQMYGEQIPFPIDFMQSSSPNYLQYQAPIQ